MRADDALIYAGHVGFELSNNPAVLVRHDVADGIGYIQGRRAGLDYRGQYLDQERHLAAAGVFRRKLDVIDEALGILDGLDGHFQDLCGLFLELVFHVHRRGRNERVDALLLGRGYGLAGGLDIALISPRQAGDNGSSHLLGYEFARLELDLRGDRKAGLNDIDAQNRQLLGNFELLRYRQRCARRLLAIAQGRIEY